jgi:ribosome biogenesis GTPase / thiamine phosphate phosphatase
LQLISNSSLEKSEGIVIRSTGSFYEVLTPEHEVVSCRIKGKFRLDFSKHTNPVAIGDHVTFHFETRLEYAVIDFIAERKNALVRKSTNLSKRSQVIAANLDHVIIVVSMIKPAIAPGFIDRMLIIAEAYDINPVIVFNKMDLYTDKEFDRFGELYEIYTGIGYTVIPLSAKTGDNIDAVTALTKGKVSLFTGQSGVGKSTLLNRLKPGLIQIKTDKISSYSDKGKHTTTHYEMHELDADSFIIDSPGMKELGLFNFEPYEVSHFMPDLKEFLPGCKFGTCLHKDEPECAVKKALEDGEINPRRYYSYLKIMDDFGLK